MKKPADNPYEILDVPQDATQEEIKTAYRKASLEHHPDHGGCSKTFSKLAIAYDILRDAKKRSVYDRMGEYQDEMDIHKEIVNTVGGFFLTIMEGEGSRIFAIDLFLTMRSALENEIGRAEKKCNREIEGYKRKISHLEKIQKKMSRKAGAVPIFESIIQDQIKDKRQEIMVAETTRDNEIKVFKASIEFLKDYDWEQTRKG